MEGLENFDSVYLWIVGGGGASFAVSWLLAKIPKWVKWESDFKETVFNFLIAAAIYGVTYLYSNASGELLAQLREAFPVAASVISWAIANKVWYKFKNRIPG